MGEIAFSSSGGTAGRLLLRHSSENRKLLLRFRNFSGRFHAPRGTVYHRLGSEPTGEIGLIVLVENRIANKGLLAARFHRYASFDRTYRSSGRVFGSEWSGRMEFDAGPSTLACRISSAQSALTNQSK